MAPQARSDGAFIAELLDSLIVPQNNVWCMFAHLLLGFID